MKSMFKLAGLLIASLVLVGKVHASAATGMNVIADSKHDFTLTYTGGGAGAINQCSTCHEMHKPVKMKPLWARQNPDKNLTWKVKSGILPVEYTNTAFDADPIVASTAAGSLIPAWAFVDSRSGLCLSCHDGTQTVSDGGMITGRANLAIAPGDLSQNHRIGNERTAVSKYGTVTDASMKAGDAVSITNVNGIVKTRYFVGCTTCHSMHSSPMENR
ncbi:MAG: hypothetical protein NDJ72_05145, partial [Elusimicrobia bacterium]|nr:hypothetical protein [Elusimicrobiota bacterium]